MEFDTSVYARQGGHAAADSSGPLSKRQIMFTNWLLLGLDIPALERKYNIPFNRDMFTLPNKAGAEAILYFLFTRLNPVMCKEEFRDCWPVRDKKGEALFYRTCNKWLRNIQKDEPDTHLPRINASLFMSPGGEKFCHLLFSFTNYVMQQVIKRECDVKSRDQLSWPQLSPHNKHLSDVMHRMLQCGVVQRREKFLEQMERSISVSEQWRQTSSEIVRENRRLSKAIRDLEHQVRDESQRAYEKEVARGSPRTSRRSFSSEQERSSHLIKRANRVQKVRDKWKKLDSFCNVETRERQVIESILDRTLQKYHIDAADISIKVPDLLLRECENEILKRHVDNTYEGGKMNILSLLQLWNLSLHLYIERFHQVGVVDLESDSSHLTVAVQTHHAQITNANAFEKMLSEDFIPLLKQSVSRLRQKVEANTSHLMNTPQTGRTRPLGFGLVSSTPPISFTPRDDDTSFRQSVHITPQQETVMTPEAADNIASTVAKSARKAAKTLFQGSPVYAPKFSMQGKLPISNRLETSKIPQPHQSRKDQQMTTPDIKSQSSRQKLLSQADHSLSDQREEKLSLSCTLQTDPVSDVLSSSQSSQSTLKESQLVGRSPRTQGADRDPAAGPGVTLNTAPDQDPTQMEIAWPVLKSTARSQNSTPRNEPLQPQGRSIDDFVDEVVAHMLDEEDTENQPPTDYLHRLQEQQGTQSLPRSPFIPFQYRSVLMDEDDLNNSNNNINQSNLLKDTSLSNGQFLSRSQLNDPGDREHSQTSAKAGQDSQESPRLNNLASKPVQDEVEVFRHPEIPIDFVKNGHNFHSPKSKRYEHRRSVGSEVFRHPEIPEDLSPEIDPSHGQTNQKVIHSPVSSSQIPKMLFPSQSSHSGQSCLFERAGLTDFQHVVEDDKNTLFHTEAGERLPAEGEASSSQDHTVVSGKESMLQSPPLQQQSVAQSSDKKLGSHLETEIRRMWRESLDGKAQSASPPRKVVSTSMEMGQSDSSRLMSSAVSSKLQTGQLKIMANGLFNLGGDDDFTTLDDVTADILLSPENWDEEDEGEMNVRSSVSKQNRWNRCPEDDLFSTETPQIPRLGSKYSSYHASPLLVTDKSGVSTSVDGLPTNLKNMSLPKFDVDIHSPLVSQSLPVFSRTAGALAETRKDVVSVSKGDRDTSRPQSVLDESLSDVGLSEDTGQDILVSLDDSFTPLLDGLQVEGKSPHKPVSREPEQTATNSDPSHDEIMARFQQLKKTVKQVLHDNTEAVPKPDDLQNPDFLHSTSSSDERLMLALEKKYVTGVNTSWSLLDDETLDNIN